ncbi:MAG TPA: VCBS repeat-containing protein [Polyangiaceae bacterium]|nr:VCBS repeat-containing protein [Polyangiaceae bacterium]
MGATFAVGCGSSTEPHQLAAVCAVNSDCTAPLICTFGRCHAECKETADCASGRCVKTGANGVCELDKETSCTYKSDCPGSLICAPDQVCRAQCQANADCLQNQVCASGSCADMNEVDSSGQLKNATSHSLDGGGGAPNTGGGSGSDHGGPPNSGGNSTVFGGGGSSVDNGGAPNAGRDGGSSTGEGGHTPMSGGTGGAVIGAGGGPLGPPCGGVNMMCCPGEVCNSSSSICVNETCVSCGAKGSTCCANDTCSTGSTCSNGTCVSCGALQQPCCGSACDSDLTCLAGTCSVTCAAPLVPSGADCVIPAPRPVSPLSGTFMNTRTPTLSWSLPAGISRATLDVCGDRACAKVLYTAKIAGTSATIPNALARGTAFWRLRGELDGDAGATMAPTSPVWQFQIGGAHDAPKTAAWGAAPDYDGDGIADLLLQTSASPSTVQLYAGSSSGLSSSPTTVASGPGGPSGSFIPGDIDGDGFVDLVLPTGGGVDVYRGGPTGFSATPSQSLQIKQDGSSGESIGDVNGDGYGDLVVPGESVDADRNSFLSLSVYSGGPSGLSVTPQTIVGDVLHQPPFGNSDTGDFNGDGYADVVVGSASATTAVASVFYGSANGLGATSTDISLPTSSPDLTVACIGDANGDGYADIVALRQSAYVYFGASGGVGKSPTTLAAGDLKTGAGTAQALGMGDMDGDGYADFVVPDVTAPALRVYRGASTGINSTPIVLNPLPPASFTVSAASVDALSALGDVDGDGYPDVGVAIDWTSTQQVHKRQVQVFSGANPMAPTVISIGATAVR